MPPEGSRWGAAIAGGIPPAASPGCSPHMSCDDPGGGRSAVRGSHLVGTVRGGVVPPEVRRAGEPDRTAGPLLGITGAVLCGSVRFGGWSCIGLVASMALLPCQRPQDALCGRSARDMVDHCLSWDRGAGREVDRGAEGVRDLPLSASLTPFPGASCVDPRQGRSPGRVVGGPDRPVGGCVLPRHVFPPRSPWLDHWRRARTSGMWGRRHLWAVK